MKLRPPVAASTLCFSATIELRRVCTLQAVQISPYLSLRLLVNEQPEHLPQISRFPQSPAVPLFDRKDNL